MLNKCIFGGRLTKEPEMRRTPSGIAVTTFTIAVDEDRRSDSGEKEAQFIECVAWRATAEFVANSMHRGSLVMVVGRLQFRSWTDRDGNKRKTAEINVENIYFGESRASTPGAYPAAAATAAPTSTAGTADYTLMTDDPSELPF